MWWKKAPALAPALGLLAGCWTAPWLWPFSGSAILILTLLAVALWRPAGWCLAALALGWWLRGADLEAQQRFQRAIEEHRPVLLEGAVIGHAVAVEEGWRLLVAAHSVSQGERCVPFDERLWLTLPVEQRPRWGDRLRLRGYLKRPASSANGTPSARPAKAPGGWRFEVKSERLVEVMRRNTGPPRRELQGWIHGSRLRIEKATDDLVSRGWLSDHGLAWLRALLLGDRQGVPLVEQQALRRTGLAHLLAVSGLHLGLVAAATYGLAVFLPWRLRLAVAALGALAYAGLLGPQPSVVRALLMAVLTLGALALSRPPEPRNALAVAVIVLLLHDSAWVDDVGFRLSVSATAGILWWAPAWSRSQTWPMRRLPPWLRRSLAASLAAQLATLPWVLQLHGGVHPLAPLLNLVALPWLAALLLCCLGAAAASCSPLTGPLALPLAAAVDFLATLPAELSGRPPSGLDWWPWSAGGCMLVAWGLACWAVVAWGGAGPIPRRRRGAMLGALALLCAVQQGESGPRLADPQLWMIDVGQGDAILLRDGAEALLVDGGGWRRGDAGGRILLPVMASLGIRRLSAVLVSHGDVDHCAGARDLLRYLPVEELWTPPTAKAGGCMADLLASSGPRWRPLWRGDRRRLGRWRVRVLHPGAGERGAGNDGSLVVQATVHGRSVLLTGDIEKSAEARLVAASPEALRSHILKVAHHGSKTSTGAPWLRRVQPRLALISSGVDNRYGHPTSEVLQRLRREGTVVLRTDRSGIIGLRWSARGPLEIALPASPRPR